MVFFRTMLTRFSTGPLESSLDNTLHALRLTAFGAELLCTTLSWCWLTWLFEAPMTRARERHGFAAAIAVVCSHVNAAALIALGVGGGRAPLVLQVRVAQAAAAAAAGVALLSLAALAAAPSHGARRDGVKRHTTTLLLHVTVLVQCCLCLLRVAIVEIASNLISSGGDLRGSVSPTPRDPHVTPRQRFLVDLGDIFDDHQVLAQEIVAAPPRRQPRGLDLAHNSSDSASDPPWGAPWARLGGELHSQSARFANDPRYDARLSYDAGRRRSSASAASECAICLSTVEHTDARMPCGHLFHRECLGTWLRRNPVCPVCRFDLRTT
ncbi:hypothetical protein M885DRAFT_522438 [Pelagophyceae sp. CCMP2097]|nr:hypothetical protein M885DRAFT_522438 [Pelagophyceae sp. CCMP2097]